MVGHILLAWFFARVFPFSYSLAYGFASFFQTVLVVSLLTIIGFILYIIGRKSFLKHIEGSGTASVLLVFLSFIPMMESIFFVILAMAFGIKGSNPNPIPMTWEQSTSQVLAVFLAVLRFSSAALLFADGIQFGFDRFSTFPFETTD